MKVRVPVPPPHYLFLVGHVAGAFGWLNWVRGNHLSWNGVYVARIWNAILRYGCLSLSSVCHPNRVQQPEKWTNQLWSINQNKTETLKGSMIIIMYNSSDSLSRTHAVDQNWNNHGTQLGSPTNASLSHAPRAWSSLHFLQRLRILTLCLCECVFWIFILLIYIGIIISCQTRGIYRLNLIQVQEGVNEHITFLAQMKDTWLWNFTKIQCEIVWVVE